ncbi:tyrosine-type recombinase/integrase [Corynebacterium provencense]|uniref:tyrosine-type recombinase/integrase n=1 Tax=Corynebacterium provencense TaxID=1737425 RepID=UPI00099015FA
MFILRAVLGHAVEAGIIVHNPAAGVKLPRTGQRPRPILTATEVERLARTVDYLPEIVRFLAYTGLRFGEASALTVADIDLKRRRINVNKAYSDVGGTMVLGDTKTYETRSVPFPGVLDGDLRALTAGKLKTAPVFTSVERRPLRHSNYRSRYFRPAVDTLREVYEDFPALTLHDLRHTAASLAISSGANVKAVQRMLGHATATETLNRYADLFPDDLDAVARGINALVKPSRSGRSGLRADQQEKTTSPVAEEMWSDLLTYWSRLRESNSRPSHYE